MAISKPDGRNVGLSKPHQPICPGSSHKRRTKHNVGQKVRESTWTYLVDIITRYSWEIPFMSQPMFLDLHLPSTLQHRVPCQFTHVRWGELVYLGSTAVLFQQMGCGKVKLQWIIFRGISFKSPDGEILVADLLRETGSNPSGRNL